MLPKAPLTATYNFKNEKFEIQQTGDVKWIVSNGPDKAQIIIQSNDSGDKDARYCVQDVTDTLSYGGNIYDEVEPAIQLACQKVLYHRAERLRPRRTPADLAKALQDFLDSLKPPTE